LELVCCAKLQASFAALKAFVLVPDAEKGLCYSISFWSLDLESENKFVAAMGGL
jgi:hypothetical protein